ncbi:MAG: hypothetical protein AAFN18_15240 [Cyanobacteria bacterium J06554_6]
MTLQVNYDPYAGFYYPDDDWDDGWDDASYDSDEYWLNECAQIPGQGCLKAGSEECDFECPFRDDGDHGWGLEDEPSRLQTFFYRIRLNLLYLLYRPSHIFGDWHDLMNVTDPDSVSRYAAYFWTALKPVFQDPYTAPWDDDCPF